MDHGQNGQSTKEREGDIITEMWMEKNLNLSTVSLFADIL